MNTHSSTIPLPQSTQSQATLTQPKISVPISHPFQVVCSRCQKTISYSGKDGEVFSTVCDECAGV